MPQLIIIEGIPGSGKTSAAQFIAEWLEARGFESALYLEGDWSHPADFESAACLNARQFQELKDQFPQYISFLDQQVTVQDSDYFFKYRWIEQEYSDQVSSALIETLACYEIYELPINL